MDIRVRNGQSFPLGATVLDGGVNFSVYSQHATGIDLILFPSDAVDQMRIVSLDPVKNKTYYYWHAFVEGIGDGQQYGFRAQGPARSDLGLRFDGEKLLVDPYTKAVIGWDSYDRAAARTSGDNCLRALRSVVVDTTNYDWEGDVPLRRPYAESVIYELHVGGFTRNPNAGLSPERRGTFAGIVDKIPYLKDLGVNAVELMPVQEFDPHLERQGLSDYWGYNTVAFFAPHHGYCAAGDARSGIGEFRDMVKALHKAGIEVILDVVFNHTGEGNENGPTQSFRGLDNPVYYLLDQHDQSCYQNFSGCGNSFNSNHPVVTRLILDCLRHWVSEMHVDGFRFDLAAALSRDVFGNPQSLPPLLWAIESDPVLAGTKLIAEAWDAAGLYRVGWFVNVGHWYAEWNGPFRDDVRRFIKGDTNTVSNLAARISGSSDIYIQPDREPSRSINLVTCHDGFTLHDLVSYNVKHNESNGESNRDGADANFSWNCGFEGSTDDEAIRALRLRQMKNMLVILFLSQGTPMILMGDEVGRTQRGNNNAYCQDSELAWLDWSSINTNGDLYRFEKELIAFTQSLELLRERRIIELSYSSSLPYITWHGVRLENPDWQPDSHSLAFTLEHEAADERLHVMLNAYWQSLEFELPAPGPVRQWKRIADTFLPSPLDIARRTEAVSVAGSHYLVMPRSAVILFAEP